MSAGALPGFRDFYPKDLSEREHLFRAWREVARRFGFVEYDGPPLEPLELYTRKSGDEIVGQLYSFVDKGGRDVALRPEMTPTFARMVSARLKTLPKPVRWFSIPQLFRYERQQKGRLREHFQLNVDIVGETDVAADADLLAVALEIMRGVGLAAADVVARVSDRRLLAALLRAWGISDEAHGAVFAAIDKIGREPMERLEERMTAVGVDRARGRSLLETVQASDRAALRAAHGGDPSVADGLDRMERYLELLSAHGLTEWVRFDLSIVRGLAYYTGIVFELFDRQGEFRAICGGGRYDNLLRDLGGVDEPALGFGMGDVVLGEILRARGLMPADLDGADFYVAAEAPVTNADVVRIATALREAGARVEYAFRRGPLGRQRKAAWTARVGYIVEVRATDEGLRLHVRDGAGAEVMRAMTNQPTLGERFADALLPIEDLLTIVRAHPRSIRSDFARPAPRP